MRQVEKAGSVETLIWALASLGLPAGRRAGPPARWPMLLVERQLSMRAGAWADVRKWAASKCSGAAPWKHFNMPPESQHLWRSSVAERFGVKAREPRRQAASLPGGEAARPPDGQAARRLVRSPTRARPISLLRLFLLRFVDSNFPGNSPWT